MILQIPADVTPSCQRRRWPMGRSLTGPSSRFLVSLTMFLWNCSHTKKSQCANRQTEGRGSSYFKNLVFFVLEYLTVACAFIVIKTLFIPLTLYSVSSDAACFSVCRIWKIQMCGVAGTENKLKLQSTYHLSDLLAKCFAFSFSDIFHFCSND